MPIVSLSIQPHISHKRESLLLHLQDEWGRSSDGEVAPLPGRSVETLEQCLIQIQTLRSHIEAIPWTLGCYAHYLRALSLLPAVCFGLESALLTLLDPLPPHSVPISALFMGSPQEILSQAAERSREGYSVAKLKIGDLSDSDALYLIQALSPHFRLRIDVNRSWSAKRSLHFFAAFPHGTFDYVEDPVANPDDLAQFPHPLALDELPLYPYKALRALIYKPTVRGGMLSALPLLQWAQQRHIDFILSSSFESERGLADIASMAYRLGLTLPIGLGTLHYLKDPTLRTASGALFIP